MALRTNCEAFTAPVVSTMNMKLSSFACISTRPGFPIDLAFFSTSSSYLAALDVFTVEPPAKDSKLVQHENVTATPHLGASTMEAQERVAIEIAEAVVGALKGELAATTINAPMVPAEITYSVLIVLPGVSMQLTQ